MIIKHVLTIMIILGVRMVSAQDTTAIEVKEERLDFDLSLRSNQLWKGTISTDKPVVIAQVSYALNKSKSLRLGIWGGMAISNNTNNTQYKEIDYFMEYAKNGLSITLWDFFTSTNIIPEKASDNIFNYSRSRTAHLFDLGVKYRFQKKIPLLIETDILVYGGANSGEVLFDDQGNYKTNKYSTYIGLNYPIPLSETYQFETFLGAGFAFNPGDPEKGQTTYIFGNGKNKFDIVNVGFKVTKNINIFKSIIPIYFTTAWNPSRQFARVQVGVNLF